jgi:hypothetical protein
MLPPKQVLVALWEATEMDRIEQKIYWRFINIYDKVF